MINEKIGLILNTILKGHTRIYLIGILSFVSCKVPFVKDSEINSAKHYPCSFKFRGVDEKTKIYKIETNPAFLFDYTHPKLKAVYKEKNFMETFVRFMATQNQLYMIFNISMNSKSAPMTYGQIAQGSPLKISFINGKTRYIKSSSNAMGHVQLVDQKYRTEYEVVYRMNKESMDELSSFEIDKIGIMWTTGFEEYDVLYVDQILNQANCILKN